jgi:Subtilase family/Peptidase inhibitor I9
MRRSFGITCLGVVAVMATACGQKSSSQELASSIASADAPPSPPVAATTRAASADRDMIVILRDQLPELSRGRGARRVRAGAIAAAQAPLLGKLQAEKARRARSFELVNGFATRLSPAEIAELSARSEVLAVVPDRAIPIRRRANRPAGSAKRGSPGTSAESLCGTLEPEALQLTHAAFLDPSVPQAQEVLDGAGIPVTGKGVKVAFIADGLDTNVPGFTRPDGSKVFIDYQDFSGDPAGTPTGGGEAFGDASSIAAQDMPNGWPLTFDISTFVSTMHPLPSPCNIRVRGIAPGVSLVGLKVVSELGYTVWTSTWVEAIDWAVVHDEVDVLNESFGNAPFPDDSADPIALADAAAVRAGVTVVAGTGDAAADSLESPGTEPAVIGVGATTSFRLYAQTSLLPFTSGYIDGNTAGFSSAGLAQSRPRTLALAAPGSTNPTLYADCLDLNGNATPIEIFNGTSESAPLTSGAAALVIQAYRSTHGGVSPAPALVKSILMSSARDLGAPSDEQGAGLLDALKAVTTALSVADENASPVARGDGLLLAPTNASFIAQPRELLQQTFQITNTGTTTLDVRPALESLAAPIAGGTFALSLDPASDATFVDATGQAEPYVTQSFAVPEGADHLDAAIAWQPLVAGSPTLATLFLVDPSGRLATYSFPQDASGYAQAEVVHPAAGTWTAVISPPTWTDSSPTPPAWNYAGPVQLRWSAERFATVGMVSPSRLTLPPGGTASVAVKMNAPSEPGDFTGALRLHSVGGAALSEIPFTVRTLIPLGPEGGSFTGTLTGGNARALAILTYAFDVPEGVRDLAMSLDLPDSGYALGGLLVDPSGMILASSTNADPSGANQNVLQMFCVAPRPGRWRFLLQDAQSSGNETSIDFRARITFDTAKVFAPALPDSPETVLSASQPAIAIPLTVTNTGGLEEEFFADTRLDTFALVTLLQVPGGATTLPGFYATMVVPPRTIAVQFAAQSPAPIMMNATFATLSPEITGQETASGNIASIEAPEVAFGEWFILPALIGPFGPAGAPAAPVTTSAIATTHPFDPSLTADSGNWWADQMEGTQTYNPLVLAAGARGTITLTLTPDPSQVGTTVRGFVDVDTLTPYGYEEVAQVPYVYTVGP